MLFLDPTEGFSYKRSELTLKNLMEKRKELGLTEFDVMIFFYLVLLSRRRMLVILTTAQLAEEMNGSYSRVAHSIKTFKKLNLCKRIEYKALKGFIVNPAIINNGDDKKKSFKYKLWNQN
jgi:predicted transcriptional regulator